MKKRILVLGLTGILLFSGCGSAAESTTYDAAGTSADVTSDYGMEMAEEKEVEDDIAEDSADEASGQIAAEQTEQKLIVTEYMNVETTEFDTFVTTVDQKVEALGGYIESSEMSGRVDAGNQYADFTIRIPADKLEEFVTSVDEKGTVVYDNKTTEDVTLQYVDTQSHLNALKTEEETLLSLLEKAEKLSDVFAIQEELTEVRYQIESYESRLRVYDNQVDYSTIHLTVTEVARETTPAKKGFWAEAAAEFSDSLYFVGESLRGFAIWFIGSIPVFVVLAVVIVLICQVVKRIRRKKKGKQADSLEEDVRKEDQVK